MRKISKRTKNRNTRAVTFNAFVETIEYQWHIPDWVDKEGFIHTGQRGEYSLKLIGVDEPSQENVDFQATLGKIVKVTIKYE